MGKGQKDLYVLVADQDMLLTMEKLLSRGPSLEIRSIEYAVAKHLHRDPGCRTNASLYLRGQILHYEHALVMFDRNGCGGDASREELQHEVEQELAENGWRDRSKVIVIDPELEAWVWSASNRVSEILGWEGGGYAEMKEWLVAEGLWPENSAKPEDPKRAMRAALRKGQRSVSSRLFGELAESVTLRRCRDPAFSELKDTLRLWFPIMDKRPT